MDGKQPDSEVSSVSAGGGGRSWLARNVVILGVVSLLTDASSEMIIPLLPMFLTQVVGAGALTLGWIEGMADTVASVLKLLAGRWSDRMGRRRPLILGGYSLSSAARPLIAFATAPWHILVVRVTDRLGKGLRSSPRDALIADSVEPKQRAAAFGLHRAMDHTGAVIGPLLAVAFLTFWSHDLRTLFLLAAIPGGLAVIVLAIGVREVAKDSAAPTAGETSEKSPGETSEKSLGETSEKSPGETSEESPGSEPAIATADKRLWRLLLPLGIFTLGNASDVFLLLKAGTERAPITALPLLWMALHVVKALASVSGGRLADRFGRRRLIVLGWIFYAAIYFAFAMAESRSTIWVLFVAYGIYHGLTEAAERALVAELVPRSARGAGFGWYHLTLGALTLLANLLFGLLWERYGSGAAFMSSAALALLAVTFLIALRPPATSQIKA
jgi:MFS family permease